MGLYADWNKLNCYIEKGGREEERGEGGREGGRGRREREEGGREREGGGRERGRLTVHVSLMLKLNKAVSSWLVVLVVDNSDLSHTATIHDHMTANITQPLTFLIGPKLSNSRRIFDSGVSKFFLKNKSLEAHNRQKKLTNNSADKQSLEWVTINNIRITGRVP